jgi:hypothetical protein
MRKALSGFGVALSSGLVLYGAMMAAPPPANSSEFAVLPKPGTKVPLGKGHYFIYGFTQSPKLGNAVMKVEIFTLDGQRDRSFTIFGDADMPSMRGAHSSGRKPFALSDKGAYLLPVQLVMPGDWEVRFTFERNGGIVFRGAHLFDL